MHFKILTRTVVAVAGCVVFAGAASDAVAQQSSLFGASGVSGGSSGVSSGAVGSSAFPTSKFPGAGATAGSGALATTGVTQQGMGANGQQAAPLLGMSGAPTIGTGAPAGMTQPGQNGQMGNRQGMQNRNNANRRTGQNRNQNQAGGAAGAGNQQKTTVRPQLLVAFDHPRPEPEAVQTAISTRFSKLSSKAQFKDIEVEMDGDTVVLRGQVDTERSGKVAVVLARMEPGVKSVRNELTVAEPPAPAPSK